MMEIQLSLFDTSPTVELSTYKVGDFVKLKKKTPHAACLKKGDIIQIEAIHPRDGSCKFWNERTESWGYVYSDEFTLVPPPKIDSVTPVEPVVTESTAPPGNNHSVTPDEPVVTECSPDHSVTPVEPVVTECSPDHSVTPVEPVVTECSPDHSVTTNAISTYCPRGTACGGREYFRFSYRDGSKIRHIHIRGGNTDSPIAIAKVHEVRSLLASGVSPLQVAATFVRLTPDSAAICE